MVSMKDANPWWMGFLKYLSLRFLTSSDSTFTWLHFWARRTPSGAATHIKSSLHFSIISSSDSSVSWLCKSTSDGKVSSWKPINISDSLKWDSRPWMVDTSFTQRRSSVIMPRCFSFSTSEKRSSCFSNLLRKGGSEKSTLWWSVRTMQRKPSFTWHIGLL